MNLEIELFNLTNKLKRIITIVLNYFQVFFRIKTKIIEPTLSGLSSGFYDLDSFTQGFQKSDLIIIAGRPSMGKTAFL